MARYWKKETQHGGCLHIQEISGVVTVTQQGGKALLSGIAFVLQAMFRRATSYSRGPGGRAQQLGARTVLGEHRPQVAQSHL